MEIIVKPKNIYNLNQYLNKGATAFLFGLQDFSVCATAIVNIKTLEYLVKRYPRIHIYIMININIFNDKLLKLEKTLSCIAKLNVAGVFFYDLAVLNIVKRNNLNLPLVWNQDFLVTNYNTCNYYLKEGVSKAVISNEITIDEVLEISQKTSLALLVNAFGYQLMSFSRRHLITNYFKNYSYHLFNKKNCFIKDEQGHNRYQIKEDKNGTGVFTPYIYTNITEMDKIINSSITGVILSEQNIPKDKFLIAIKLYDNVINHQMSVSLAQEELAKVFVNLNEGFLHNKTIYKVKNNE